MTTESEDLKEEILRRLSEASEQRLRPYDLEIALSHRLGLSMHVVQQAVRALVDEGKIAYTYRDPASYIELAEHGAPVHPV